MWPRSPITLETRLQAEKTAQLLTALGFGLAGRKGSVAAFRVGLKLVGSLEKDLVKIPDHELSPHVREG